MAGTAAAVESRQRRGRVCRTHGIPTTDLRFDPNRAPVMNDPHVEPTTGAISQPDRASGHRGRALTLAALTGAATAVLGACGGGGSGGSGLTKDMEILEVSNGFGLMLPHRVQQLDGGVPSEQVLAIRSIDDVMNNVTATNPILPVTAWNPSAVLPNGAPGNHFVYARFTQALDLDSIFAPGSSITSDLSGSISIVAIDPATATSQSIPVRAFVNGRTADTTSGAGSVAFPKWIGADEGGSPVALDTNEDEDIVELPGLGFPGTQGTFDGAEDLVRADTLVLVADSDGDLTTYETFPAGVQISLSIGVGVRSQSGNALEASGIGVACGTVGVDTINPEVAVSASVPSITPGNGAIDVDPQTSIKVEFTESIQPTTLGNLDNGQPAGVGSAILVRFGPDDSVTSMPFTVRPFSPYDLTSYELIPGFAFPGTGPDQFQCGTFNRVDIDVTSQQFEDLTANLNVQTADTFFETGEGPGLVNAPVAPDVVYVGRTGSVPGVSVIDLNGFGASTGIPTYSILDPIQQGNSNYPNNPNFAQANQILPPLEEGTCTFNGGSQGVFTLTMDSSLNDKLIRPPLIDSVGEMAIGQPLDITFNNGPPPFGCQAGFPNLCASTGLKQPNAIINPGGFGVAPAQPGQFSAVPPGSGNLIAWAPHPNPPPLVFPPPCVSPFIGGQEPTSVDSTSLGLLGNNFSNLLAPLGDPFGSPENGIPPSGLLANEQNAFFVGPSLPAASVANCARYQQRQQVGHFLYMIDRIRSEVVVINSNRFTVIDRIGLPDPTSMSMSPNVDLLAVTNRQANLVSLIDIDPRSATFHQIVASVPVGTGPSGISWQPDNEDILVCNELDNSVSIISMFSLQVRKTLNTTLDRPFDVAVGHRQLPGVSLSRQVYFAFILNRNGRVSVFESGPDGPGGIGTDTLVGQVPLTFDSPKGIFIDTPETTDGFYVLHEGQLDLGGQVVAPGGALTQIDLQGFQGPIPLAATQGVVITLAVRDINFVVRSSTGVGGPAGLTGVPIDLAFDNQVNSGGTALNFTSQFAPGSPPPVNSRSLIAGAAAAARSVDPRFIFLAVPNSSQGTGAVDVLEIGSGLQRFDVNIFEPGIQSIRASGATHLCDYFRY